ncbi:DUF6350 family protein [Microbacterium indicum]|uniref:cell division protein PerM n=1 Tax=Microbacterium indicum TaxID=358100 RepID=UPI000409020A|nr:DUF6350 family protein [Microbacterium indicum]
MHRVLVAILAAVDALVSAAVSLVVILAPLTLLWIVEFGDAAWGALWPATARVWQAGHLVPLAVRLDDDAQALTGVASDGASFALSLAPLLFAAFTFFFAARSGRRAVEAGATIVGVATGTVVTAGAAALVGLTSENPVAHVALWQAIVFPAAIYAVGMIGGAIRAAWNDGDGGAIDLVHDQLDRLDTAWREVPTLVARGTAVVVTGVVGVAALLFAISVAVRGGEVVTLFERAGVDPAGATALTLVHVGYLPTAIIWAMSWIAGPGFAVGSGTAVSPSGSSLGVVPGVPMFGLLPEGGSGWFLLVALVPVAFGALAGFIVRRAYDDDWAHDGEGRERYAPRVVIALGIAVATGAVGALLAQFASGSIGPGRLAEIGPQPGAVALTLGLEALVGAAILLLAPMRRVDRAAADEADAPSRVD